MTDKVIEFKDNIKYYEIKLIKIMRYLLKRLPKPYDTQCQEYSGNETQFHCLNKCYEKSYQNQFQCIPKYNSLLTIQLHNQYIQPNVTFCQNYYINNETEFNIKIIEYCQHKCPVSCQDNSYLFHVSDTTITLHTFWIYIL